MVRFFVVLLVAISLSMDTFSLSLAYGTLGLNKSKIFLLSIIVGIFHFIMPFLGNIVGLNLIQKLPINSDFIVGIIFILIAFEMFKQENTTLVLDKLITFVIFGFTVSIDSFTVGIGLSKITNNLIVSYFIFAITSFIFTFVGLFFGKFLNSKFGKRATIFGSVILLILGLIYIF